jgi:hypothetical protein
MSHSSKGGQALTKPSVRAPSSGSERRTGRSDEGQSQDGGDRWSQIRCSENAVTLMTTLGRHLQLRFHGAVTRT